LCDRLLRLPNITLQAVRHTAPGLSARKIIENELKTKGIKPMEILGGHKRNIPI